MIVDYLQLMTGRGRFENRNQEVSALSRGMKLLAKELNVPMMVLSQLSRAVETRQGDHRPQLSDLRESGSIEQDADLVGFIFREEVYNSDREDLRGLAELIVAKQRNGPVGTVNLVFLHAQTKFENRAEDTGELPERVASRDGRFHRDSDARGEQSRAFAALPLAYTSATANASGCESGRAAWMWRKAAAAARRRAHFGRRSARAGSGRRGRGRSSRHRPARRRRPPPSARPRSWRAGTGRLRAAASRGISMACRPPRRTARTQRLGGEGPRRVGIGEGGQQLAQALAVGLPSRPAETRRAAHQRAAQQDLAHARLVLAGDAEHVLHQVAHGQFLHHHRRERDRLRRLPSSASRGRLRAAPCLISR